MLAGEREGRIVMVERGWLPGAGGVTGRTTGPELPAVGIVFGMAGITIRGCILKKQIAVAAGTCRIGMCAGQFEAG